MLPRGRRRPPQPSETILKRTTGRQGSWRRGFHVLLIEIVTLQAVHAASTAASERRCGMLGSVLARGIEKPARGIDGHYGTKHEGVASFVSTRARCSNANTAATNQTIWISLLISAGHRRQQSHRQDTGASNSNTPS